MSNISLPPNFLPSAIPKSPHRETPSDSSDFVPMSSLAFHRLLCHSFQVFFLDASFGGLPFVTFSNDTYSALRDAISMENRYFTSDLTSRS